MGVFDYFKKEDKKKPDEAKVKAPEKKPKPEDKKKPEPAKKPEPKKDQVAVPTNLIKGELAALVLEAPHISEKSTLLNAQNQYVFRVASRANKPEVKKAIEALYKVKVTSVNIINRPPRPKSWQRKPGYQSGYKKAIVTLKAGDRIEIVP